MPRPLEGRFVLDFTTLLPGPLATLMLASAGAQVIKVERPGGEDMRGFPPFHSGASVPFAMLNRGKTSLELDLKGADALVRLEPLLQRADILIEQFRPGVMARLGLGYEQLKARFPRLIYCSISGYGQAGARAGLAGHDLNYVAETGLLGLSHGSATAPSLPPTQIADIGGGSFPAVINILLALIARERSGEGCYLDIAMTDAMHTFAPFALADGLGGAGWPRNRAGLLTGGRARYNLYAAADGRVVAIGAVEDKFWHAACAVLGVPAHLRDDDEGAECHAFVADCIAKAPGDVWEARFQGVEACVSVVKTIAEARSDPHLAARAAARGDHSGGPRGIVLPIPIDPLFR